MRIKKKKLYETYNYRTSTYYKIIKDTNGAIRNQIFELWRSKKLKGSLVVTIHKNLITDTYS